MNSFTLDETINSRTAWGLRVTAPPVIAPTRRIVESIEVDGREGTLTLLKGWDDITFKMRAALIGKDIQARFRAILPVVLAAKSIYFSNDATVYFKIKHVAAGGLERRLSTLYDFQLTFTCEPFRYLRNVTPINTTISMSLPNQGNVYALPKITAYGTGNQTLNIGGRQTRLNILAGHLTLDSALMECYQGNTAQNNQMQGPFPILNTGNTVISFSGGIQWLQIEPGWRYI